jgi:hypothetical protein
VRRRVRFQNAPQAVKTLRFHIDIFQARQHRVFPVTFRTINCSDTIAALFSALAPVTTISTVPVLSTGVWNSNTGAKDQVSSGDCYFKRYVKSIHAVVTPKACTVYILALYSILATLFSSRLSSLCSKYDVDVIA